MSDSSQVTASYTVPTVTNSSWTVSDNGTSGTVERLAFTNLNGVTLSLSTGAAGQHTIVGSHNALTSQSNQNVTAANGGFAFQTLSFSNLNGVSFGTSAGSAITASVAAQTNQTGGIYVTAQSTGQSSSSTYDVRTLSFVPDGIISAGWSNGSFRVSATQSNQNVTAGNGGFAFQTLSFSNVNGISFGTSAGSAITASHNALTTARASTDGIGLATAQTNVTWTVNSAGLSFNAAGYAGTGTTFNGANLSGSMTVNSVGVQLSLSAAAPGGGGTTNQTGPNIGVSNLGNTAGSTGTISTGTYVLVGSGGISLSQSTAAAGSDATVTIYGAPPLSYYCPFRPGAELVVGQHGQASLHVQPFVIPHDVVHDRIAFDVVLSNSSNSTASITISQWIGIYTRSNVSTLNLLSSTSTSMAFTVSGTVGNFSLQHGHRLMTIPWTNTLTVGNYWAGVVSRTTSAGGNATLNQMLASQANSAFSGILGAASNASVQARLGLGTYSASTSGIPGSIAFTQLTGTGTIIPRTPVFHFISQTV